MSRQAMFCSGALGFYLAFLALLVTAAWSGRLGWTAASAGTSAKSGKPGPAGGAKA